MTNRRRTPPTSYIDDQTDERGDIVPRPDPTALTTAALKREVQLINERFDERYTLLVKSLEDLKTAQQALPNTIEIKFQDVTRELASIRKESAEKITALAIETSEKATEIAKETAERNRPPWQVIFTGVGVMVTVFVTIGWMALSPVQTNISELQKNVVSKSEQEIHWNNYEARHNELVKQIAQLKEDLEGRDKEILELDHTFIPRTEFENLKTERNKNLVTQQELREFNDAREALFVSKDQFNAVEKRIDDANKMLAEMEAKNMTKEAFTAWKTERDKLIDTINQRIDKIYGLIQEANRKADEIDKIYRQKGRKRKIIP